MKFFNLMFVFLCMSSLVEAGDNSLNELQVALATLAGVVFLTLIWMSVKYKGDVTKLKEELSQKEEKIVWLKQLMAQNEQKQVQKEHENEKAILELKNRIKELEAKAKESSKNQVVAMIESQRTKRDKILDRLKG